MPPSTRWSSRNLHDIPTPFAVIEAHAMRHNIRYMASALQRAGVRHMPHTKTHKCKEIAAMQLAAGASGLTVATIPEAEAMLGVEAAEHVLVARALAADPSKHEALASLADLAHVTVVVEELEHVEALARACRRAGTRLGVLVELDIGFGRAGCRSVDEAVAVAVASHRSVKFEGLMGYEAHAMHIEDDEERAAIVHESLDILAEAKDRLEAQGIEVETVSAGGTITYKSVSEHPAVTDVRSGGYVFMHASPKFVPPHLAEFRTALSVVATVIGAYADDRIVLDAGLKSVSTDGGSRLEVKGLDEAEVVMVTEEHLVLDVSRCERRPQSGDRMEIVSMHSCTTANLHSRYVVREGAGDDVADVWDVVGRY